jgi:hypothetical protein
MARFHPSKFVQSYGDYLSNGTYSIHSRFNNVINFISEDFLISIVAEEIGAGPLNIVVSGFDLNNIHSLMIEEESYVLNDIKYDFEIAKRVDSTIKRDFINIKKFLSNLKVFENCLSDNSPPKSLTFLMNEERKSNFKTSFEKEFLKKFKSGEEQIFSSNCIDGIKKIKGLGFGFTPSGDDFICGLLLGMNIACQFFQYELTNKINEIFFAAKGGNPISNAYLLCAKQGLMFEKFKKLVFSILYLDDKKVIESTERLCAVGATSGADMGVGFLKAFG